MGDFFFIVPMSGGLRASKENMGVGLRGAGLEDEEILLEMMPEPPVRNGDDFVLNSVHVADLDPGVDEFLLER